MARGRVEGQIVPPAVSAQLIRLYYVVAGSGGQTRRNQQECDQGACDLRQRKAFHSNQTSLRVITKVPDVTLPHPGTTLDFCHAFLGGRSAARAGAGIW